MPSQYDSPTQTGGYDSDGGDPWFDYDAQQEESDSEYEREIRWQMRSHPGSPDEPYSPTQTPSRNSSSLSFSVLTRDGFSVSSPLASDVFSPITSSESPSPRGDAVFSPDTPSSGLPQPWCDLPPLPPLREWFAQPLYNILTLPPDDIPTPPPPQQSLSGGAPSQQPAAVNDALNSDMQRSVHELTLSQFFDAQGVREITEALAQQQQQSDEQSEEIEEQNEPEERYFLREEDIDIGAIRERSVVEMRFAREMPTPEPEPPVQPASTPQAGYTAPPVFIPPYTYFLHEPTVNDGRLPHQVEALEYLCTALFCDSDRLKWFLLHRPVDCFNQLVGMTAYCHATKRFSTIAHITAIIPETHVSVTGTIYIHYLQRQLNYAVIHDDYPMVELSDGFLAPLESLTLYYHV